MIDSLTRNNITYDEFKNYCFVYRVTEYKIGNPEDAFMKVDYSFVDKKFKKGGKELHTFYISDNYEYLKIIDGKIVFPHPLFLKLRESIENQKIDEAKGIIKKMLQISPNQKDVYETAKTMELL